MWKYLEPRFGGLSCQIIKISMTKGRRVLVVEWSGPIGVAGGWDHWDGRGCTGWWMDACMRM
jgi:hypothetical protein